MCTWMEEDGGARTVVSPVAQPTLPAPAPGDMSAGRGDDPQGGTAAGSAGLRSGRTPTLFFVCPYGIIPRNPDTIHSLQTFLKVIP